MNSFNYKHIFLPFSIFILIAVILEVFQVDIPIADFLYSLEGGNGGTWPLEHNFFTEAFLHTGGKYFSMSIGALVVYFLVLACYKNKYKHLRKPLVFLVLSTVFPLVTVSILKSATHVDCPWDLIRYGGENPYIPIFSAHPGTFEFNRGFPASHSCSAFMWIALYYFFMVVNPKFKFKGLFFGLILGSIYGIGQQLRGAHFFSHDIWSLAICWTYSTLFYFLLLKKKEVANAAK